MSPLHVRFATEGGCYVYDSITNRILRVGRSLFEALPYVLMGSPVEQALHDKQDSVTATTEARGTVEELRMRYGAFRVHSLAERGTTFSEEGIRDVFASKGISSCSLELTERCNFRCKYCTFSGGYANQRTHGRRNMSWSVAKSAVDLYLEANRDVDPSQHLGIGFYGGEPFLRFSLMRKVIEHAKQHPLAQGRNVLYHATTNGSLLTEDKLSYLQANDFGLLVSLDGPREHHDRNRVLCDGSPTFDLVLYNMRRISSLYPDYYRQSVSYSVVLAPESNLLDLDHFFTDCDLFHDGRAKIRSGSIADGNASYGAQHPPYPDRQTHLAQLQAEYYACHVKGTDCSPFVRQLFERPYLTIHKRQILEREQSHMPPALPICIPGQRKLYVACDGRLHMCEKIGTHLPIGHVATGIDFQVVIDLLNRYRDAANAEECRSCWAHRFCPCCFAKLGVTAEGSFVIDRAECEETRENLLGILAAYCRISELNPSAWDYMDAYQIS